MKKVILLACLLLTTQHSNATEISAPLDKQLANQLVSLAEKNNFAANSQVGVDEYFIDVEAVGETIETDKGDVYYIPTEQLALRSSWGFSYLNQKTVLVKDPYLNESLVVLLEKSKAYHTVNAGSVIIFSAQIICTKNNEVANNQSQCELILKK